MNQFSKALSIITIGLIATNAMSQAFKPSKNDQLKAGKEYAAKIRKDYKVLPDSDPRVKLLRELGKKILAVRTPQELKKEPWEFTFDVIESKEVNAFAVPGGPMFFFTGLIDRMQTVDELAGVLGHEIQHIRREHWASSVNSSQEKEAGLLILGAIFGASRQQMQIAQIIKTVGYDLDASRGQESEADRFGIDNVVRAGYNPEGMALTFEMFRKLKGSGSSPEFLSTHPDDKRRIENIRKMAADLLKKGVVKSYPPLRPFPFQTEAMRQAKAAATSEKTKGTPPPKQGSK